jgi:hypothetical protein
LQQRNYFLQEWGKFAAYRLRYQRQALHQVSDLSFVSICPYFLQYREHQLLQLLVVQHHRERAHTVACLLTDLWRRASCELLINDSHQGVLIGQRLLSKNKNAKALKHFSQDIQTLLLNFILFSVYAPCHRVKERRDDPVGALFRGFIDNASDSERKDVNRLDVTLYDLVS